MTANILEAATNGHSFFLLGQAGTGKTFLLRKIRNVLIDAKKKVQVCASTGIAASQLGGKTVHSFFGLQDGRYKTEEIIFKLKTDPNKIQLKKNIEDTDTLIIDEISMLSNEIFHQIEQIARSLRNVTSPFGGLQVIAAGDFYQLRPVPNTLNGDKGELLVEDESVKLIIPHHFILKEVHRQKEGDLIAAVQELSRGCQPSKDTIQLITKLQRPLPMGATPVRLYSRNYDVEKSNSECLLDMEGDMKIYKSEDQGDLGAMKRCTAPQTLHLKVGAPVMLLANLTHQLVNGKLGVIKKLHDTHAEVKFHGMDGVTCIKPYLFSIFDPKTEKNVAFRKQLPLRLAFAMTVHKAQGMTHEQVFVDCRKMTVPGQIGVAIGRVRTKAGLQIINFLPSLVQPQPQSINDFYQSLSQPLRDDCYCCVKASYVISNQEHASQLQHNEDITGEEPNSSAFSVQSGEQPQDDDPDDETLLQFVEFCEQVVEEGEDSTLPTWIKASDVLDGLLYSDPVTKEQKELNDMVNFIKQRMPITNVFLRKIFSYLNNLFQHQIGDDMTNVANIHFTTFYSRLYQFYSSNMYKSYVKELFTTEHVKSIHYRVAFGIIEKVRGLILDNASAALKENYVNKVSQSNFKVFKQSVNGWGVIRYLAGWCIGKLMHKKERLVTANLYLEGKRDIVQKCHKESLLLETLTSTAANLSITSSNKSSLLQLHTKEFGGGSLCYVTDNTFNFFKHFDYTIRKYETDENVNLYGKDMYSFIYKMIQNDKSVINMWNGLFEEQSIAMKEHISIILEEVIHKYLKMSCSQFRKEYLHMLQVKKGEAPRKQIKMKQTPKNQETADTSQKSASVSQKTKGKGKSKAKKQKVAQWPCGGCGTECVIDCVCCDACDVWYHYQCVGLYGDEEELNEDQWFCFNCQS